MGLPACGSSDGGGGTGGGGEILSPPPEKHQPIYCNSSDTGAICGGGTADGRTGDMAVVGARGSGHI